MSNFEGVLGTIFILVAVYMLASSAGLFAERSGTINLAIEGGMVMGALGYILSTHLMVYGTGTTVEHQLNIGIFIVGILTGIVLSVAVTSLLALGAINLRGDQVVIGTAINIMTPIISLIVVVLLMNGNFFVPTSDIQITTGIKTSLATWQIRLIILGVVSVVILGLWVLMKMTTFGMRLRSAGENPHLLAASGISVYSTRHIAMLISGILAGMAGAVAVSAYSQFSSYSNTTFGMGFVALAILILGQWRMWGIVLGGVIFSIVLSIADYYTIKLSEYKYFLSMIPYVLTIVVLPLISKYSRPPKYDGIPYVKQSR